MKLLDTEVVIELLMIMVFTAIVGFYFNHVNPSGVSLIYEKKALRMVDNLDEHVAGTGKSEPVAIKIEQAEDLYFNRNVLFLDARLPVDYKLGHVKGAKNLPVEHFGNYLAQVESLNIKVPYVTYCSGTDCNLAEELGDSLSSMGFEKIYIFYGGWNDWKAKNYPTEEGQ
jgi:rhodanese-related sulfurtransferase